MSRVIYSLINVSNEENKQDDINNNNDKELQLASSILPNNITILDVASDSYNDNNNISLHLDEYFLDDYFLNAKLLPLLNIKQTKQDLKHNLLNLANKDLFLRVGKSLDGQSYQPTILFLVCLPDFLNNKFSSLLGNFLHELGYFINALRGLFKLTQKEKKENLALLNASKLQTIRKMKNIVYSMADFLKQVNDALLACNSKNLVGFVDVCNDLLWHLNLLQEDVKFNQISANLYEFWRQRQVIANEKISSFIKKAKKTVLKCAKDIVLNQDFFRHFAYIIDLAINNFDAEMSNYILLNNSTAFCKNLYLYDKIFNSVWTLKARGNLDVTKFEDIRLVEGIYEDILLKDSNLRANRTDGPNGFITDPNPTKPSLTAIIANLKNDLKHTFYSNVDFLRLKYELMKNEVENNYLGFKIKADLIRNKADWEENNEGIPLRRSIIWKLLQQEANPNSITENNKDVQIANQTYTQWANRVYNQPNFNEKDPWFLYEVNTKLVKPFNETEALALHKKYVLLWKYINLFSFKQWLKNQWIYLAQLPKRAEEDFSYEIDYNEKFKNKSTSFKR